MKIFLIKLIALGFLFISNSENIGEKVHHVNSRLSKTNIVLIIDEYDNCKVVPVDSIISGSIFYTTRFRSAQKIPMDSNFRSVIDRRLKSVNVPF